MPDVPDDEFAAIWQQMESWGLDPQEPENVEMIGNFLDLIGEIQEMGFVDELWDDVIDDLVTWALENDLDPNEVLEGLYELAGG